ncbi:MAG: hypothetical protein GX621_16960 [Pirellulaceae bacterium]|nr:hypothetical protein [Pirellulaceae bacterium]
MNRIAPPLIALGLLLGMAAAARAQSVWELTPYRVRLIVALAPSAELTSELAARVRQGLSERAEAVVGAKWDLEVLDPEPRLRHRILADVSALEFEDLPSDSDAFDKVVCVAVVPGPTGHEVQARELDVRTRVFSRVVRLPVWQTAKLLDTIFRAVIDGFTPLARVVGTQGQQVTLRLRAADLPTRDPSLPQVAPGDVFQPMIRYEDRAGKLRKAISIPWTFLVVEQCDDEAFTAALHSALTSPMSGRHRGRVDPLALAVRPTGDTTRVVLTGRVEPYPILANYKIYEQELNSRKTRLLGQTDMTGAINVGRGDAPLRLLVVKSGRVLLARLPVVPGLEPELTAEIRDDDQRLVVEGFANAMQFQLIDLIIQQRIVSKYVEDFLNEGKIKEAEKLVAELRAFPAPEELIREINNEQMRTVVEDKWTKKKVDELFDDTRSFLRKHYSTEPAAALDRAVVAAQRAAREKPKTK